MSKFYFAGTLHNGKVDIKDIPVFGFQTGKQLTDRWPSADVDSQKGLEDLTIIINPQVPVHFAMPKKTADTNFKLKQRYEKVTVDAYRQSSSGGYMSGKEIRIVFINVSVHLNSPLANFPIPSGVQARYFQTDKGMGRDFLIGASVKLVAQRAEVVPS